MLDAKVRLRMSKFTGVTIGIATAIIDDELLCERIVDVEASSSRREELELHHPGEPSNPSTPPVQTIFRRKKFIVIIAAGQFFSFVVHDLIEALDLVHNLHIEFLFVTTDRALEVNLSVVIHSQPFT